ncbi:amino acid permease [Arthrobacter sp. RIT-PI-e]|uniref:APC family permease n=1 Tax=Arthrobacter sp. RIT-PI-e TaxID=1681197 RepID=UPI0006767975|nr:APC family permease [Arthrobacter sp. RIT-PI-e]KNC17847.1 amino acid permease [Arthrobacter sp. RIT-PI-e]
MTAPVERSVNHLARNQLGVPGVVFLVLAAVAPLTAAVVVAALAIALGNGGGVVMAFVIVAVTLLLFAVGYAQMSKDLVNASGFYAFIVKGLGRTAGLVAGFVATMGYNFFVAGAIGTAGFFTSLVLEQTTGLSVHWYIAGVVIMAIAFLLARGGIDLSAVVLGIALVLEVLILLTFSVSVLVQTGFSLEVFSPDVVFGGSLGIGLLLAATAFLGFEATSLFSEEAKDPHRTIPRATYTAIVVVGLIHAVTVWAIVSAVGVADAQQTALDSLAGGDLVLVLVEQYLGPFMLVAVLILLVVSLLAAQLAFHNVAARYLFSLGRAGILPAALARTRTGGVPQNALIANAGFATIVAGIFAVTGLDAITTLVPIMIGFGTLCILVLQTAAALAVVVHFRRRRDPRWVRTFLAPALGCLGLLGICTMAIANFAVLAGSDAWYVMILPWLLVLAVVAGLVHGAYLRARRPEVYARLESDLERFDPDEQDLAPADPHRASTAIR